MQQDISRPKTLKIENRTDRHGIKWLRYEGDAFWQTSDVARVKAVLAKAETPTPDDDQGEVS